MVTLANWHALAIYTKVYVNTPSYLLIAWIIYPFIKVIHELGHALAVKHWGGEVRETGITLFMLTPAPYVDASAANAFRHKYQRVVVGAIGIMIELLIAVVALWIFFNIQPGLVRDTAFVAAFICGVSSFLFNGNPLVRFDAYYVSMLSEKYKAGKGNLLRAFFVGILSNIKAMSDYKKCSSVIYILKKR